MKTILVTGGAGFIGTNFIRFGLAQNQDWRVINLDALSYAGNAANLDDLARSLPERYRFVHGNICDRPLVDRLLKEELPDAVVHFAAESHVDRSIHGPLAFIQTNVNGTGHLLMACHTFWQQQGKPEDFRFVHISTDEVFGSLGKSGFFRETTAYAPSSPYSASKAASDHLARAWHHTYGLPVIVTNCSNNYGPYQFPEKLIPLIILNILEEKELPVYGDGLNVRDWLFVEDHCEALAAVLAKGSPGQTYCIGGGAERSNIEVVRRLCRILDQRSGRSGAASSERLIRFVKDRPGHDRRYAINASKIRQELGWRPRYDFDDALSLTVDWYLANRLWIDSIRSGSYLRWIETNYEKRGGSH
ncbi:MAG: dTDP-glucose 4,6-dehydratase [Desulfosarcinaceae bacterium]